MFYRNALFSRRQRRSAWTSRLRGVTPCFTAMAAAVPAAWPIPMQGGITRMAPAAVESALTQRPATSRFSTPTGSRLR